MAITWKQWGDTSLKALVKKIGTLLNSSKSEAIQSAKTYTDNKFDAVPTYNAGTGIRIDDDGKINVTGDADINPTALPKATNAQFGAVKVGEGLNVTDGVISVPAKSFKTVNGESIEGTGNITIDLSLYKVVTELPTANIEDNKIYLVQSTTTVPDGELNVYVEWIHVNNKWEKLGEFKTAVDLTPYAKTADVTSAINTAKGEAISTAEQNAAAGAAELYMSKTELANTYQKQADMPQFVEYTETEIQTIVDAAMAEL